MNNHLAGFVISGLLHASLVSGAIILSKEKKKEPPSIDKVALMVSMFQAETKAPVKTIAKPVQKPTEKIIETLEPLKVASLPPVPEIKSEIKPVKTPKLTPAPVEKIKPEPLPKPTIEAKPKPIPAPIVETKPEKTSPPKLTKAETPTPKPIKPKKVKKQNKVIKKKIITKKIKKPTPKKTYKKPVRQKVVKKNTVFKKRLTKKKIVKVKPRQHAVATPIKRRVAPKKYTKKVKTHSNNQQANRQKVKTRTKPAQRYSPQVAKRGAVPQPRKAVARRSAPTAASSAQSTNLSNQYKARLRQLIISKKRYPKRAKRRSQQGKVTVSFSVRHSGVINNIRIIKSSNSTALDNAAVQAIKQSSKKLPFLRGMHKQSLTLSLTLNYILR